MILHAGLIAARIAGFWRGVLIEGPSGSGQSDLALRALSQGFRLVADDRVVVWASGGRLFGRAPEILNGLIELRGLGVMTQPSLTLAEVAFVVRAGVPERLPDPAWTTIRDVRLPRLDLALGDASTPAKLKHALTHFDETFNKRI